MQPAAVVAVGAVRAWCVRVLEYTLCAHMGYVGLCERVLSCLLVAVRTARASCPMLPGAVRVCVCVDGSGQGHMPVVWCLRVGVCVCVCTHTWMGAAKWTRMPEQRAGPRLTAHEQCNSTVCVCVCVCVCVSAADALPVPVPVPVPVRSFAVCAAV